MTTGCFHLLSFPGKAFTVSTRTKLQVMTNHDPNCTIALALKTVVERQENGVTFQKAI